MKRISWSLKMATMYLTLVAMWQFACSGASPQVKIENPTELCATAVALSSEVKAQAAKLGIEPIELARRTCEAAFFAAQLAEANLSKASGIAGATSSPAAPSMGLAGAAGAAGAVPPCECIGGIAFGGSSCECIGSVPFGGS